MRLLAPTASASLLVRLSLVPHRAHALCSSAAAPQRVHLKLDAPVRHLFEPQKKRVSLRLPSAGALPLQALRAALRERCGDESVEPLLEIRHGKRRIESDEDLVSVLAVTATYGGDGPTLQVVARSGSQLPPPPPAATLLPPQVGPLRLVSFFRFASLGSSRRQHLLEEMSSVLARLGCRGSVYVAPEGVNGQLSVPEAQLDALSVAFAALRGVEGLKLNVQHASLGTVQADAAAAPYRKLIVREKRQILTDGLTEGDERGEGPAGDPAAAFDWDRAGTELAPADWHAMLPPGRPEHAAAASSAAAGGEGGGEGGGEAGSSVGPILLDCRNDYESSAGTFLGAEPLDTSVFSESWEVLRKRLDGVPRERPIMTFCTGGIRCVKTNAFLEQELGFTNTFRLRDGIHGYLRHVRDTPGVASKWEGDNFVFYEHDDAAPSDDEEVL
mmetsp:Transcript_40929/g.135573  ORF Transcript_40929/g.135573 Transcript_40929/m.135573 type:complete len:443 (+) Transcript_40929:84-1412(+)|eukprot:CAMPEP_0202805858 /NCGR_PEP_ID=MMETSP1388-20130828/104348_1 /ASSEMBLY_ACC=CAM_ASM_000864 /TAXON_ID=37098 /ORGANISM="Isochrysis sp, Strain CCMP1244" /LENGTH=442 /DNA_ID=CAMNT_0049475847 /DNA_START=17 /DNA_END=1345 /DNA_ORIENTATION=-